jgi:hypothetical protein
MAASQAILHPQAQGTGTHTSLPPQPVIFYSEMSNLVMVVVIFFIVHN